MPVVASSVVICEKSSSFFIFMLSMKTNFEQSDNVKEVHYVKLLLLKLVN